MSAMDRKSVEARLSQLRSRGQIKALGRQVDSDPALRAHVEAIARDRGHDTEGLDGRRLVRAALNREEQARVRSNPVHRDPGFVCVKCGAEVGPGGARVRDHCPFCLHGQHVDETPGDRASDCGGVLEPVRFSLEGRDGVVIGYRCAECGAQVRNRAHIEDRLPVQFGGSGETPAAPDLPYDAARTLPRRVLDTIRSHGLWEPGMRVLVSVSGGLDSTVLLELLVELSAAHKGVLEVVSIDHGLRPAAVHEVAMVGRRARDLGLSFEAASLEVDPGANLQDRARHARRDLLLSYGTDRIATAHHRDDQAETVLGNLLRGAGAQGLSAMQVRSGPWVRPLLFEPRAVLEAWARTKGLRWVEDPSNAASRRGQMRQLWPELDALHGDAAVALARSARLLAREDALLETLTEDAWVRHQRGVGLDARILSEEHPALCLRLLRRLVQSSGIACNAAQLEAALIWEPAEGARLPLSGGASLLHRAGILLVDRE